MNTIDLLLEDFGVDTEDELSNKLFLESQTIPCIICKKEFPIEDILFLCDDPICKRCKEFIIDCKDEEDF